MSIPEDLKYTKDHEWARIKGNIATIGITDHAQQELGEIVFVDLPEVEDEVTSEDACGSVESTKAVSDLFSPLSGKVSEINENLEDNPELVNQSPYMDGWMMKVEISEEDEIESLMDSGDYKAFIESDNE